MLNTIYRKSVIVCVLLLLPLSIASAQKVKPQAKPKPLLATVKQVSGIAQRLVPGKPNKWVNLKIGDKLSENTIIRTGFRSKVVLAFEDKSIVTINRATKMGISEFKRKGKLTKMKVGLKYGSLHARVERARGPSDFRVATPVATLAVTGSEGISRFSGDFGFEMTCRSGKWNLKKGFKSLRLTGGESTNNRFTKPINIVKKCATVYLGNALGGMSRREITFMRNHGGGRGVLGFVPSGGRRRRFLNLFRLTACDYRYSKGFTIETGDNSEY